MTHAMLPAASHDELAEQLFVRDLKVWLTEEVEPQARALAASLDPGPASNARTAQTYERLLDDGAFRDWASVRRASQELMWDAIGRGVARQREVLEAKAAAAPALGSLSLDPDFVLPDYLAAGDVHLMPGGYQAEDGGIGQGAIMDRGGAVYMLGKNGGFLNDGRGKTIVQHLFARYPGFAPTRILELGCGIGASIVPVATAFPEAEVHGVDVGASMLRYALARARHLGVAIDLAQGSAERTRFDDASFDLVFSATLFHETSQAAIGRVLSESRRLLRPGGVAVHLEVPQRYDTMDLWGRVRGRIEADYNNEPAWQAAISADYLAAMRAAGFAEVTAGYQDACFAPDRAAGGFSDTSKGVFRSWFVASGRA
ncbi:class I SAM-dependent methyltransferase [uncultured Sphingomonas sp.]|uniref:class I SAM-dependent methyltransferase n=1 Tax=uncultured Sphingomonas sp. TaxID=158754 RepID=UPI0035CAF576